ncbi:hypothetical protein SCG7086_CO_00010, partial [Chlamydiales bacterium SCGC AG-110-P3]
MVIVKKVWIMNFSHHLFMCFTGWFVCLGILLLPWGCNLSAALALKRTPKEVAIDWSGMDENDGHGSDSWSAPGETINVTLSVLCNARKGYNLTFHSNNAVDSTHSLLKHTSNQNQIGYMAVLDVSGVQDAIISKSTLELLDAGTPSVIVTFRKKGMVLPKKGDVNANLVRLDLTLDPVSSLLPVGTYT